MHHVRGGRGAGGEPCRAEHVQVGDVSEHVHHHDDHNAQHQRARQIPLRLDDLLGDEVGLLPAAVGEQDGDERGTEGDGGGQQSDRSSCGHPERSEGDGRAHNENRGPDQRGQRRELQDREDVLRHSRGLHAHVVNPGEHHDRRDGERHGERLRQTGERQRVIRERDGHRRDGAGRDDEQQRPPIEECGQRAPCLTQVHVAATRLGAPISQLAETERTDQRDQAAESPGDEDQPGRADALCDGRGSAEDAAADDAAGDRHRGGKQAETAGVGGHGRQSIPYSEEANP